MSRALSSPPHIDLRQGLTEAERAVLDEVERLSKTPETPEKLLAAASKASASALRADLKTGNGRRRIARAQEAAALLILALNRMDESGQERRQ